MKASLRERSAEISLACLLVGTLVLIGLLAAVPPVSRDALTHHLSVPKLYLQYSRMVELPHIECSYYPQLLDLLYCLPLYFKKDIVPKYIHFGFALATAWLIFRYLRSRLPVGYAWVGALFFLTLPVIVKLSITVYVDLGLIFFTTAAMMSLLRWREKGAGWGSLLAAGVFAGLAAGTKYNGLIVVLLLFCALPFLLPEQHKTSRQAAVRMAFFLVVALIVFSPWMIRNYIWTQNPVYPLYARVFNGSDTDEGAPPEMGWTHFLARKYVYQEKWWETVTTPVRIFFLGQDDNPRFFDGVLSPFLCLLPLLAFRGRAREIRAELRFFLWFAVLYVLLAYLKTDMRVRYISPAISGLVVLSVFGLHNLKHNLFHSSLKSRKLSGAAFAMLLALVFAWNYHYLFRQFQQVRPLEYLSGQVTRDEYIARYVREYPLVRYVNRHTPGDAKILAMFLGRRQYYFDRDVRFKNNLFPPRAQQPPKSIEELWGSLSAQGFTHILVRYDLFNQRLQNTFDDEQRKLIQAFFQNKLQLLHTQEGYGLYEIKGRL